MAIVRTHPSVDFPCIGFDGGMLQIFHQHTLGSDFSYPPRSMRPSARFVPRNIPAVVLCRGTVGRHHLRRDFEARNRDVLDANSLLRPQYSSDLCGVPCMADLDQLSQHPSCHEYPHGARLSTASYSTFDLSSKNSQESQTACTRT